MQMENAMGKTGHQKTCEHVARAIKYSHDVRRLPSSSPLSAVLDLIHPRHPRPRGHRTGPPFAPWDLSPGDHKTAPAGAFFRRGWAGRVFIWCSMDHRYSSPTLGCCEVPMRKKPVWLRVECFCCKALPLDAPPGWTQFKNRWNVAPTAQRESPVLSTMSIWYQAPAPHHWICIVRSGHPPKESLH